jgi:TatD DNase family protein
MSSKNNAPLPISQPPAPNLVDTHCHIHETEYPGGGQAALERANAAGVEKLICIGTDETTSQQAVEFAANHDNCWASVGLHPHDAVNGVNGITKLKALFEGNLVSGSASHEPQDHALHSQTARSVLRETQNAPETHDMPLPARKIVAIGECGLDYFYEHSPRKQQIRMLRAQIELAQKHNLPLIFHVRDAFDDFWPVFDQYKNIRGVLHSYTDTKENLQKAMKRGLFIGVNGIATFTKIDAQKEMYKKIPLEKLVLETDAPFLTPVPKRGTVNEPANARLVAKYMADLRRITLEELSAATSQNANTLFKI